MRNYTRYRPRSGLLLLALLALVAMLFAFRPSEPTASTFVDTPVVLVDVGFGHELAAFAGQVTDVDTVAVVANFATQLNVFVIATAIAALALVASRTFGGGASRYGPERRHRLDHYANRRTPAALGGARPLLT